LAKSGLVVGPKKISAAQLASAGVICPGIIYIIIGTSRVRLVGEKYFIFYEKTENPFSYTEILIF
jgi:hypothetical protein